MAKIETDVIQRITSRLGKSAGSREEAVNAVDYDWRQCHHYSPAALTAIKGVAEKAAAAISDKLTDLFHSKPEITVSSVEQLFARELTENQAQIPALMLHFKSAKGKTCGFVGFASETAVKWAATLLGDDNKKEPSASLSELEETLLLDMTSAIGQILAKSISAAGGAAITVSVQFEKSGAHQLDPFSDVCKIVFGVKTREAVSQMDLVLLCEILDSAVGMGTKTVTEATEKTKSIMLEYIKPSAVPVEAMIGNASVSIKDLAELKPGDVIVLEKMFNEPIDVIMNGKMLCSGQLAACDGRYAVVTRKILRNAAK